MTTYHVLLKAGWHMQEIDNMDFLGWMHVMAYNAMKKDKGSRPGTIDALGSFQCGLR
jgi:hypothetical protein